MIGIFDSGFGGLSTLKELLKLMPEYDYLYLGDSARSPYGGRSQETIKKFTEESVLKLFDLGAQIVLIACNSASSDALRFLQSKFPDKKVLGVIVPAVEEALKKTRFGRIGVVGTTATIEAGNYEKEIKKNTKELYKPKDKRAKRIPELHFQACPLLVPLVEEGWHEKPEARMIVRKYLRSLKQANIDTLILACTHYPLMEKTFQRKIGKRCQIINSARSQAKKFVTYLGRHPEIEKKISKNSEVKFFTTDDPERFSDLGSRFLGFKIKKVEKI